MRTIPASAAVAIAATFTGAPAFAQTTTPASAPPPATPAAPAPAEPASANIILPAPGMTGPLGFSPTPFSIDLGPAGKTYVTGVLNGLGPEQSNPMPGNKNGQIDISNAQIMIQKTDGLMQYYVQVGAYTIPAWAPHTAPSVRQTATSSARCRRLSSGSHRPATSQSRAASCPR
jgi:hypothetical protein